MSIDRFKLIENELRTMGQPEYCALLNTDLSTFFYTVQMDYEYDCLDQETFNQILELFPDEPTYVAALVCVGTEPYVTHRLEYDIKDVNRIIIIPESKLDEHDVIRVTSKSKSKKYLELVAHEEASF